MLLVEACRASVTIFYDHLYLRIPVVALGSLVSLGPVLALSSRLLVGMAYSRHWARIVICISTLGMGITNFLDSFVTNSFGRKHERNSVLRDC